MRKIHLQADDTARVAAQIQQLVQGLPIAQKARILEAMKSHGEFEMRVRLRQDAPPGIAIWLYEDGDDVGVELAAAWATK